MEATRQRSAYWFGCQWRHWQPPVKNHVPIHRHGSYWPVPSSTPCSKPKTGDLSMRKQNNQCDGWQQPPCVHSLPCMNMPFAEPPLIKGNHRLPGLNFHPSILFGSMPASPTASTPRGVNSYHKQNATKFCKQAVSQCQRHQLAECINLLLARPTLHAHDLLELEDINSQITRILVTADKNWWPQNFVPWSLALQQMYLLHCYWSLRCAKLHTQHNLTNAIKFILNWLDPQVIQEDATTSLSTHLCQAQM